MKENPTKDGQFSFDDMGNIQDNGYLLKEEEVSPEIYEDGSAVEITDFKDFNKALIKGENLPLIEEQLNGYIEEMVNLLVKNQKDKPFKKGDESVAWNPDFILFKARQEMSANEQVVFDLISGVVSSNPQDAAYTIDAADVRDILPFEDKSYAYRVLEKGSNGLKKRNLTINALVDDRQVEFSFPFFNPIAYVKAKNKNTGAKITFIPTPILRMFLISATIAHGGYYKVEAAAKISSKYGKLLYYLLESKKNFRKTPVAPPGKFTISLDELQAVLAYPKNYRYADVNKYILEKTKKAIDEIDDIDITFTYEPIKSRKAGGAKKQVTDIEFSIYKKVRANLIEHKSEEISDENEIAMKAVLQGFGYTEREIRVIVSECKKNNRSLQYLTLAVAQVNSQKNVKSPVALLINFIQNGFNTKVEENPTKKVKENQSGYDFDEIKRKLSYNPEKK